MNESVIKSILNKDDLDLREKIALITILCYLKNNLCSLRKYELKKLSGLNNNNLGVCTKNLVTKGYIVKINNMDDKYKKFNFKKHQNVYCVNETKFQKID